MCFGWLKSNQKAHIRDLSSVSYPTTEQGTCYNCYMLFYSAWKLTQGRGQSWSLSMVVSSFPARSRWVTSTILHLGKVVRTSTFCDLVSQGLRAQKITETPKSLVDTLPIKDIKDQNSAFCEVMISGLPNPLLNSSKPFQTLTVKPSKSSVQRFAGVRCRVRWGHIQHM